MLNKSQLVAKQQLVQFLLSDEKYFCLSAAAGFGKSYLLNHIKANQSEVAQYGKLAGTSYQTQEFQMCATTNKAAGVLDDARTVHKAINLRTIPNDEGELDLIQYKRIQLDSVLIVDEASCLTTELDGFVQRSTKNKVIYVGDHNQLKGVNDNYSVFEQGYPTATLTEPMRQDPNSPQYKLCEALREGVEKQIYVPIDQGVIAHTGSSFAQDALASFREGLNTKVLAYTNKAVDKFNLNIHKALGKVSIFAIGTQLVSTGYTRDLLHSEQEITVFSAEKVMAKYPHWLINGIYKVPVGTWFKDQCREYSQAKAWTSFYHFKESYCSFSLGYASTVHKSQGSTYDNVFLDLPDINKCRDFETLTRLKYVAASRARGEIHVFT